MTNRIELATLAVLFAASAAASCSSSPTRHTANPPAPSRGPAASSHSPAEIKKDVCDVYGFASGQVNTAQRGYEAVMKLPENQPHLGETPQEKELREDRAGWHLSLMTTQMDDYSRRVQKKIADPDTPGDLAGPLGEWASSVLELKNSYWNHEGKKQIDAALAHGEQAKKAANGACGL